MSSKVFAIATKPPHGRINLEVSCKDKFNDILWSLKKKATLCWMQLIEDEVYVLKSKEEWKISGRSNINKQIKL